VVKETRIAGKASPIRHLDSLQAQRGSPVKMDNYMSSVSIGARVPHNKFRNKDLEQATAQIEEEFNRLLKEGASRVRAESPTKNDEFYKLMGDFYTSSPDLQRHASPTKRLIA